MKILAIDTSSSACSVALLIENEIKSIHQIKPQAHAQTIFILIHDLLTAQQISFSQLDALAYGCGPGSFVGVRIAVSVIQGLGFGLTLPVIPISSLAALAQAASQDLQWNPLFVAVDARMNEIYWGHYALNHQGLMHLVGSESVGKPQDIILPASQEGYGVGDAWSVYQSQIPYQPLQIDSSRLPTASAVALLAKEKYLRQDWISAIEASPVYLKELYQK